MKVVKSILTILLLTTLFTSCNKSTENKDEKQWEYTFKSFLEVPGITQEEIAAIEKLQKEYGAFTFGMVTTTEAFQAEDGTVGGFFALFCEWLSGFFGIPFQLKIFQSHELVPKLDTGEVDFAGHLVRPEEDQDKYFMTDIVAERQFVTIRLANSRNLNLILEERSLKYVVIRGSPIEEFLDSLQDELRNFEALPVTNNEEAFEALINGKADAYVATSASLISSDIYPETILITEDFLPMSFVYVPMVTAKKELEPVVNVINKAMRNGAENDLVHLYNQGQQDYIQHRLSEWLTDEERAYIDSYVKNNKSVPILSYNSNYPLAFFNNHENEWQGIFLMYCRK